MKRIDFSEGGVEVRVEGVGIKVWGGEMGGGMRREESLRECWGFDEKVGFESKR